MELLFVYFILIGVISGGGGALASDADPVRDFCVADYRSGIEFNGYPCKDLANVTGADFSYGGLAVGGIPYSWSLLGASARFATVDQFPAVNTMGISMARVDFVAGGVFPPHSHPRAAEIIFVVDGLLEAGFVTTSNQLFSQTICKGGVFVFPRGLIHFAKNIGNTTALVLAAYNSQLPGTQFIAPALFAAVPEIPDDVLAPTFRVTPQDIEYIKSKF